MKEPVKEPVQPKSLTSNNQAASPFSYIYNLEHGQYIEAIETLQQIIEQHPAQVTHYWYLGLALLLYGQEADAQVTWMTPLLEAEPEQAETWISELVGILHHEAIRQNEQGNLETAWLIRQHLREFAPDDLNNLLQILRLALQTQIFSFDNDVFDDDVLNVVTDALHQFHQSTQLSIDLMLEIIQGLLDLDPAHPSTIGFIETYASKLPEPLRMQVIQSLLTQTAKCRETRNFQATLELCDLCTRLTPNFDILSKCLNILQHGDLKCLMRSIALAEQCLSLAKNLSDRFIAINGLLSSWIYSGGNWHRSLELYQDYKALLLDIVQGETNQESGEGVGLSNTHMEFISTLLTVGGICFYFEDNPEINRPLRNQIAQIAQSRLQTFFSSSVQRYQKRERKQKQKHVSNFNTLTNRPLKIGYLAGSLRQHSVGWLCRWLLKYHNDERVEAHLYSSRQSDDLIQRSFRQQYGDRFHDVPSSIGDIAERIYDDDIDILVELDSLTSLGGCGVVALKPAPIQVHWLGFDASGIPGVDYFIADPYVLPENAQDYYHETIWRLPQTYIAVDGFEVHVPSLRREDLDIPSDAVVYFSGQTGMKRNINLVRSQLQILKQVPGSYFLIKSFKANPDFVKDFFHQVAAEEGVSSDRLRFMPDVPSELTHRANLGLVDIVLDTYPYNGATTTLEALWMGLPIVTRVGEQFAARNSYTMMMNVGVTEGIARTDEDYVEWGVRLGKDAALRQKITYQLMRSRQTSPLWNGQQFARDMEYAYEQMWKQY